MQASSLPSGNRLNNRMSIKIDDPSGIRDDDDDFDPFTDIGKRRERQSMAQPSATSGSNLNHNPRNTNRASVRFPTQTQDVQEQDDESEDEDPFANIEAKQQQRQSQAFSTRMAPVSTTNKKTDNEQQFRFNTEKATEKLQQPMTTRNQSFNNELKQNLFKPQEDAKNAPQRSHTIKDDNQETNRMSIMPPQIKTQGIENLKDDVDFKKLKDRRNPNPQYCHICEDKFRPLLPKYRARFCKMCGKEVCQLCSNTKRQVCKSKDKPQRICDKCDLILDNWQIENKMKQIESGNQKKLQKINDWLSEIDNRTSDNEQNFAEFETKLRNLFQNNVAEEDKHKMAVSGLQDYLADLKTNQDSLQKSILNMSRDNYELVNKIKDYNTKLDQLLLEKQQRLEYLARVRQQLRQKKGIK